MIIDQNNESTASSYDFETFFTYVVTTTSCPSGLTSLSIFSTDMILGFSSGYSQTNIFHTFSSFSYVF